MVARLSVGVMAVVVVAGAAGVACTSSQAVATQPERPPTGVLGKEGKIGFTFHSNAEATSCTFGCAMMKGTEESVRFDPSQPEGTTIESSDPAVIPSPDGLGRLTINGVTTVNGFFVKALAPGKAELRLKSASGELLERIDLAVEVPTQVTLTGAAKTVKVGETIYFTPKAIGADGKPLEAVQGWTFAGDAPAIATVNNGCGIACFGNNDFMGVKGLAAGTVNATAKGAGVAGSIAVTITP